MGSVVEAREAAQKLFGLSPASVHAHTHDQLGESELARQLRMRNSGGGRLRLPRDASAVMTALRHQAMPRRGEYAAFLENDKRFKIDKAAMAEQLHD